MAHVIIPTKSNIDGLSETLSVLLRSSSGVDNITIVTDGPLAYEAVCILPSVTRMAVGVLTVPLGSGIHVMWNAAMNHAPKDDQHVLFLNDDVSIDTNTVHGMEAALDSHKELGLVCPQYSPVPAPLPYQEVTGTCGGRYDGTGGLGGFCMMLAADLAKVWRFDESMKWWCGDDDVLNWVRITQGRKAAITPNARCSNNTSWTINNDPPLNFSAVVAEDVRIYHSKSY